MEPKNLSFRTSVQDDDPDPEALKRKALRELVQSIHRHFREGDYQQTVAVLTKLIEEFPSHQVEGYQQRGDANFMRGEMTKAIADYQKAIELKPQLAPFKWQLGLALYYAEEFEDGVKLFESHQKVNSNDVENAVWHFLCVARLEGIEEARKQLIPISGDSRIPMAAIHKLFAGTGEEKDVLNLPDSDGFSDAATNRMKYYGNLYLGLYFEAAGETDKSARYIQQAIELAPEDNDVLMYRVAHVHQQLRQPEEAKQTNESKKKTP